MPSSEPPLGRRALAEALGTGLLVATVVGSGIHAERLTADAGLQLGLNVLATVVVLVALILTFGPVSGAHLNPAVTVADRLFGGISTRDAGVYVLAQLAGGCLGAIVADLMFGLPAVELATRSRDGVGTWLGEVVATAGLLLVIFGVVRSPNRRAVPYAVGAWIGAAALFTSSTSFANPAVTVGRALSDTYAGIAPASVPAFVLAQLVGALLAVAAASVLFPDVGEMADDLVVPHHEGGDRG